MYRILFTVCLFVIPIAAQAQQKTLYDFETADDVKAWSNLVLPKAKEPPVKIELSTEHATSGKHSLKLTFAGGAWPTVTTTQVSDDWLSYKTFEADVYASRECLVGFTVMQEKSERGSGWEAMISRWTKTALLQPGKNLVRARCRSRTITPSTPSGARSFASRSSCTRRTRANRSTSTTSV